MNVSSDRVEVDRAELGRLRWRCRRGTTEMDRLLLWFLDQRYVAADADTRRDFRELLEQQDPDLWRWFTGADRAPQPRWQALVDAIRQQFQA